MHATVDAQHRPPAPRATRAAIASFLGSTLEYYDFYIYASAAALVFGKVFFPSTNPATGTLLSLASFGVAYIARPIGAVILGHFGDRVGRKRIMLLTVLCMGSATTLIGCLPSYHTAGVLAPVLLVILRVLQGISAAGEQSGAGSLTMEHAPAGRRAFFASWTLTGTQAGFILATVVFLAVADLPDSQLLSWGWRIPFWCSLVVVVLAYVVRRRLEEPEVFQAEQRNDDIAKYPVALLLRTQSADLLRVVLCAFIAVVSTVFAVFGLAFATGHAVGVSKTTMLLVAVSANILALITQPLWAILADRIGRRPVFIGGVLGSGVMIFVYFTAIMSGSTALIYLTALLLIGVCYSAPNAVWPTFYAEMFATRVRLSGMAIGTQIGFALAGFAPTIAWTLVGNSRTHWLPVAILVAVACALSAGAAFTARETYRTPLTELGVPTARV
ncbi:MFS transporter [Nocardia macrotermitis]|uniref:Proline/betaine transporter n=1 Tax=Nocardia macrotermitis TaxID=2585198 RepID=A0A7K0DA70_9NOCA|nr:MFS transporter [Nocardia macrotermitis]MQY22597.1 Proline/betaine transporter [Nocardia macrotermitis]